MIGHILILVFLLLSAWNLWLVLYIKQLYKIHQHKYLKEISILLKIFLIFCVLSFIRMYLKRNLNELLSIDWVYFIEYIRYLLDIWIIYIFINILLSFRNKHLTKNQKKWMLTIGILILLSYSFRFFYPNINSIFVFPYLILDKIEKYNKIIKILVLFGFCFFWYRSSRKVIRISRFFSLLFIIAYGFSVIVVIINWNIKPYELSYVFNILSWSIYLLAPLIWIQYIYLPYAQSLSKLIGQNSDFDSIYKKYNISPREKEIIELIIDGKSNNEIKETLFISYHTVKNHLSNIYEKLNVKNRHELVHLFIKSKNI